MKRHEAVYKLSKGDLLLNTISSTLDIINQCPNSEEVKEALSKDLSNAATYIIEVCSFIIDSKEQESIILDDLDNIFTMANEIEKKLFGIHKLLHPDILNIRAIINNIKDAREYNTPEPQEPAETTPRPNDTRGAQPKGKNKALHDRRVKDIEPYINKALKAKLCIKLEKGSGCKWCPSVDNPQELLAYFAEKLSSKLNLTYKILSLDIQWAVFEELFNVNKNSLKSTRKSWLLRQNKDDFLPNNHELIDRIIR